MARASAFKRRRGGKENQPRTQISNKQHAQLHLRASSSGHDLKLVVRSDSLSDSAEAAGAPSLRGNSSDLDLTVPSADCEQHAVVQQHVPQASAAARHAAYPTLQFGKRFAAESARLWTQYSFDYKAAKTAIREDIQSLDARGSGSQAILVSELRKVSEACLDRLCQLEATVGSLSRGPAVPKEALTQVQQQLRQLHKFAALSCLAAAKAIKKRDRHLKECFGEEAARTPLHGLDLLLANDALLASPRIAALTAHVDALAGSRPAAAAACGRAGGYAAALRGGGGAAAAAACGAAVPAPLGEHSCPMCLDSLLNPVVLSCSHRFCWGCLVAHCMFTPATEKDSLKAATLYRQGQYSTLDGKAAAATVTSPYRLLLEQACSVDCAATACHGCPVCGKPQVMGVDTLHLDAQLSAFVKGLQGAADPAAAAAAACSSALMGEREAAGAQGPAAAGQLLQQQQQQRREPWGVIPPQPKAHQGKLTVLLDIDGTLISSFTPRRAPRLPPDVRTHVVGVGSQLNPAGVFVVERPGLRQFLEQLCGFAEVIAFTAGLEDYARPIIDALDPEGAFFSARIYREGCLKTEYYQCVKDMARLNRDLSRTVLLDDTPLAFLHQPDNGIPIMGFRGDPEDSLLMEAVLPLLQALDQEPDVRKVLSCRFDMVAWFKRHGFPVDQVTLAALAAAAAEREQAARLGLPCGQAPAAEPHGGSASAEAAAVAAAAATAAAPAAAAAAAAGRSPSRDWLLLSDFDRTLVDFSACERLVEQLAPELLPMLMGQGAEPSMDPVPLTNTLLAELQRRGVSRDLLLSTLQGLGAEVPPSSLQLLRSAKKRRADVRILSSSCNGVFLSHILAGARASGLVDRVVASPASFESVTAVATPTASAAVSQTIGPPRCGAGQKLVARPLHHHGTGAAAAHYYCGLCPPSMCKGREVRALKSTGRHRAIVLVGEGHADICAARALGPEDFVFARRCHALAEFAERAAVMSQRNPDPNAAPGISARVTLWDTQEDLNVAVQQLMSQGGNSRGGA